MEMNFKHVLKLDFSVLFLSGKEGTSFHVLVLLPEHLVTELRCKMTLFL